MKCRQFAAFFLSGARQEQKVGLTKQKKDRITSHIDL